MEAGRARLSRGMPPPNSREKLSKNSTLTARLGRGELQEQDSTEVGFFLIALSGQAVGQVHPLKREQLLLGRGDDVDIQILDAGLSRRHAILHCDFEKKRFSVEDLESHNGTTVNGARLQGMRLLKLGDKLQLGMSTVLRFSSDSEPETQYALSMYSAVLKDTLTGAYNRRYLDERLASELSFAARHSWGLSLLFVDIDHFKKVNDTHDHLCGDAVLRQFARRVSEIIRAEDELCRYGGEEFAIICKKTREEDAAVLAERIRMQTAEAPFVFHGIHLHVTVSIGVACYDPDAAIPLTPRELVAAADGAMLRAKAGGRNRTVLSSS